jgi:hypothetical protein
MGKTFFFSCTKRTELKPHIKTAGMTRNILLKVRCCCKIVRTLFPLRLSVPGLDMSMLADAINNTSNAIYKDIPRTVFRRCDGGRSVERTAKRSSPVLLAMLVRSCPSGRLSLLGRLGIANLI